MKLDIRIQARDSGKVADLVKARKAQPIVEERRTKNEEWPVSLALDHATLWENLVVCLLTTQNNADRVHQWRHGSLVGQADTPRLISLEACLGVAAVGKLEAVALAELATFRRKSLVARQLVHNLAVLDAHRWTSLDTVIRGLLPLRQQAPDPARYKEEREAARWLQMKPHRQGLGLKGLGPKQSRNFLQMVGITRYEIPIDSRLVNWCRHQLNLQYLPVPGLADEEFYSLVCDRLREVCLAAHTLPCIFDAAVFSLGSPRRSYRAVPDRTPGPRKVRPSTRESMADILFAFRQHTALYQRLRERLIGGSQVIEFITRVPNQIRYRIDSPGLRKGANFALLNFGERHLMLGVYFGGEKPVNPFRQRPSGGNFAYVRIDESTSQEDWSRIVQEIGRSKIRRSG